MLYICGSINQTTQLHQVSRAFGPHTARFTPYFTGPFLAACRELGFLEGTIGGKKLRERCLRYLEENRLAVDLDAQRNDYDLVITSSDVVIPPNIRHFPIIAVQEGILDPHTVLVDLVRVFRWLPRWLPGTAATGLSGAYERFCVASAGYRDHFIRLGANPQRVVVTGIPNFDDIKAFNNSPFPDRGYVLACTSDARETFKFDRRSRFIRRAREIAERRPLIFKLHPNENVERATREIRRWAPGSKIYTDVPAEHLIAHCEALVTQYSSLAFVGLALEKPVYSYFPMSELRRLMPVQNRCAAQNIARVCREVLGLGHTTSEPVESAA